MKKGITLTMAIVSIFAFLVGSTVCYAGEPEPNFSGDLLFYYNFEGNDPLENKGDLEGEDLFVVQVDTWLQVDDSEFNGTVDSKDDSYGQAAKLIAGNPADTTWPQFPERVLARCEEEFTISFWYLGTEETKSASCPISFCGNGIEFYACFEVKNGVMTFFYTSFGDADTRHYLDKNQVSVVGWHMYTLTCVKGDTTDKLCLYVDGVLVDSSESYKMYDVYGENMQDGNRKDLYNSIGRGCWDWPMSDGAIDEIRVYNYAFQEEYVQQLYTTPFVEDSETPSPTEAPQNTATATPTATQATEAATAEQTSPAKSTASANTQISSTEPQVQMDDETDNSIWIVIVVIVSTGLIVAVGIIIINKVKKK